jgi:hypothetical protein
MVDLKGKVAGIMAKLEGGSPDAGDTKYHTQARARNAKRNTYRAEIAKDEKGMYTLTPEKVTSK